MKHSTRRGIAAGAFAVTAALLLAACSSGDGESGDGGDDDALTPVKLQLQWLPRGQFAGYFAAVDQGFFEEEGLDVEIIPSGGDIVPQDALANGDVDYAIAWVPDRWKICAMSVRFAPCSMEPSTLGTQAIA